MQMQVALRGSKSEKNARCGGQELGRGITRASRRTETGDWRPGCEADKTRCEDMQRLLLLLFAVSYFPSALSFPFPSFLLYSALARPFALILRFVISCSRESWTIWGYCASQPGTFILICTLNPRFAGSIKFQPFFFERKKKKKLGRLHGPRWNRFYLVINHKQVSPTRKCLYSLPLRR